MRGTTHVPSVYTLIRRDGKFAFVLRTNTGYLDGTYSLPAGHVEDDERMRIAAAREALEEIDVHVGPDDLRHVHTMQRNSGDHIRIDVFFEADQWTGEPKNNEPDMHGELAWFAEDDLPFDRIMDHQAEALRHIVRGERFSEIGWDA